MFIGGVMPAHPSICWKCFICKTNNEQILNEELFGKFRISPKWFLSYMSPEYDFITSSKNSFLYALFPKNFQLTEHLDAMFLSVECLKHLISLFHHSN
jgi:hypothetical protein